MASVVASILSNLRGLGRFGGRQDRKLFWPYALMVLGLMMAAFSIVMVPEMVASMRRMQQFAVEHPELSTVRRGPGSYSISIKGSHPELMPDVAGMLAPLAIIIVATAVLLAAAVTRRLHDIGWSGRWGLIPFPFLAFAGWATPQVFSASEPDMGLFFSLFVNNLFYLASLAGLLFLLVQPSRDRRGRAGPASPDLGSP